MSDRPEPIHQEMARWRGLMAAAYPDLETVELQELMLLAYELAITARPGARRLADDAMALVRELIERHRSLYLEE